MKLVGVSRAKQYSPQSEDRDAAIFNGVASRLAECGHEVELYDEGLLPAEMAVDLIFSMARSTQAIRFLKQCEDKGVPVVNSAYAIESNNRLVLSQLFSAHGIHMPLTRQLQTSEPAPLCPPSGCWLKRFDASAQTKSDVVFCHDDEDVESALSAFRENGIMSVIMENHIQGDLLKFYGVYGQPFFHYYYPTSGKGFSKFGLEQYNGAPAYVSFDATLLHETAELAATLSRFYIYGGDAVVAPDGTVFLIDFNDWPSFSPCLQEATTSIANYLMQKII